MARKGTHYRKGRSRGAVLLCCLACAAAVCAAAWLLWTWAGESVPASAGAAPESAAETASSQTAASSLPETASQAASSREEVSEPEPEPVVTTARVSASGDNLIHDGIYLQAQKRAAAAGEDGYDFAALYEHVAPIFADYDLNLINVETLVSDELAPSSYPRFCSPGDVARELYRIGMRGFFLANNHIYDKGAEGIGSTLRFWDAMPGDCVTSGLLRAEETAWSVPVVERNGIRFALLAFTESTNGLQTPAGSAARVVLTSEEDTVRAQVEQAAREADVVIVSAHWGTENTHTVSDSQRAFAQKLADWGADIVIGTHPHVVQPIETVTAADGRSVPVAYSLGNFVSAQDRLDNLVGIVLGFEAVKTVQPDGTAETAIQNLSATPVVMHYDRWFANMRLYLLSDYTDELAAAHGIGTMSVSYVKSMLAENLDAQVWQDGRP